MTGTVYSDVTLMANKKRKYKNFNSRESPNFPRVTPRTSAPGAGLGRRRGGGGGGPRVLAIQGGGLKAGGGRRWAVVLGAGRGRWLRRSRGWVWWGRWG